MRRLDLRRFRVALLLAGALAQGSCDPTTTITVTTTQDGVSGSLRDAVQRANAETEDAVVIELPSGTYELTRCWPIPDDSNENGDLDLTTGRGVTLRALGPDVVIRQTCAGDRVLDNGVAPLTLIGVTITGGSLASSDPSVPARGGGVRALGDVTLERATITGNSVVGAAGFPNGAPAQGGGLYVGGALHGTDSTLSSNTAKAGAGFNQQSATSPGAGGSAEGGGAYVVGALTISGGRCLNNHAIAGSGGSALAFPPSGGHAHGGGIAQASETSASEVDGTSFADNTALGGDAGRLGGRSDPSATLAPAGEAVGGALYATGALMVQSVSAERNRVVGGSSGILFVGTCPVTPTPECRSVAPAGAAHGGAVAGLAQVTVTSSTLNGNEATSGDAFTVCSGSPCTWSGSPPAPATGGAAWARGPLGLWDGTCADNSARQGAGAPVFDGLAAGGCAASDATITCATHQLLRNTAVRGHGGALAAPNVSVYPPTLLANNHADGRGGAIFADTLEADGMTARHNRSLGAGGGALAATTYAKVRNSNIHDNRVEAELHEPDVAVGGGGIWAARLDIAGSQIVRNHGSAVLHVDGSSRAAPFAGGGIGADTVNTESVTVADNAVSGPTFAEAGALAGSTGGGGIAAQTALLANTTLDGNDVSAPAGAAPPRGAAVLATNVTLHHTTIADNTGGSSLHLATLISYSSVAVAPADRAVCTSGTNVTLSWSNWFADSSCVLTGTDDRQGPAHFALAPLGDYGGPVPTRPPAIDSVLVDSARCEPAPCNPAQSNCTCTFPLCSTGLVDARGVIRPQNGMCDAGAVEVTLTGSGF